MYEENHGGGESSQINPLQEQNPDKPDERRIEFCDKGIDFLGDSETGSGSKPLRIGNRGGSRELILSYQRENPRFEKEKNVPNYKGKEVASEDSNGEQRWVERDFLDLNGIRGGGGGGSSKREIDEEFNGEQIEKKPRIEALNLSLALPSVSLSLNTAAQNGDPVPPLAPSRPSRSIQSLEPSNNNNNQTTCSNDFTAASLSYSYSHPFSHNPSCSLTRNSTENYEYSLGSHGRETDQIRYGGEGTNGSVHSRFKPIADGGVLLPNHGGGGGGSVGYHMMNGTTSQHRPVNKASCNNNNNDCLNRTTSSENQSFFPSELPAKPKLDTHSGDSRGRSSDHMKGFENFDGGRARKPTRPERFIRDLVSESIPVMAQMIQEMPEETLQSTKDYLGILLAAPEKKQDLIALQNRLERRSDLSMEILSKAHKVQLDLLVSIKTGLLSFVSGKNRLPLSELIEIFLLMRCRNVNCKSLLPVDDCDCKICSGNKGFCRECMCPVCLSFDCANNTCSWVGCDVCSHWCHAACGIWQNLIKPGPSLKGPSGTTEMQFHCIGCGHASEMFGFVKDVFLCCAKDWSLETLVKELDCVRKIFSRSEDFKGKELQRRAGDMLAKLERKTMSSMDACDSIIVFFNCKDGLPELPANAIPSSKGMAPSQSSHGKHMAVPTPQPYSSLPSKYASYNTSSSSLRNNDLLPNDLHMNGLKVFPSLLTDRTIEDEFLFGKKSKKDGGFESLESVVWIKELEARMFQARAEEARREAEEYQRMVRSSSDKMEVEYAENLGKLCLKETEERRRKKQEELRLLENSQCDYYNMKMRMQDEIAGLLERMEATKQQWV